MNEETNPYLPPVSPAAPQRPLGSRRWQVDGLTLMVRDCTVLPPVDLLTGRAEDFMKTTTHTVKRAGVFQAISGVGLIGIYILLNQHFGIRTPGGAILFLMCGGFVLELIAGRLGWSKAAYTFTSFCDPARHRAAMMRKAGIVALILVTFGSMLLLAFNVSALLHFGNWLFIPLFGGVFAISGLAIWSAVRDSRLRPDALEDGWIRLKSIHPEALRFLQAEQDRLDLAAAPEPTRSPLTIRVFLHRFPLPFLLDGQFHKVFLCLRIAWLKWTRSPRFERIMAHHSEARAIDRSELHPRLSESAVSWLNAHPDWHFVHAESLVTPQGDATTQTVILTRHDRLVTLRLTRTWLEIRPEKGRIGHGFLTRLTGGILVCTIDQAFLNMPGSQDILHRFRGKPEAGLRQHLARIHEAITHPPASDAELLDDLRTEKETGERLLIANGLQSAPEPASAI